MTKVPAEMTGATSYIGEGQNLCKIMEALVESALMYGAEVWESCK